jgi:hypothetical protein
MIENDYPISEHYKPHIVDGETIARGGGWWTAVLLIADPVDKANFVALYRWQHTAAGWKVRKQFSFRATEQIAKAVNVLQRFAARLAE